MVILLSLTQPWYPTKPREITPRIIVVPLSFIKKIYCLHLGKASSVILPALQFFFFKHLLITVLLQKKKGLKDILRAGVPLQTGLANVAPKPKAAIEFQEF